MSRFHSVPTITPLDMRGDSRERGDLSAVGSDEALLQFLISLSLSHSLSYVLQITLSLQFTRYSVSFSLFLYLYFEIVNTSVIGFFFFY